MSDRPGIELASHQRVRLAKYSAERCVDMHCHVLPAVDDGPASIDDTLALCRALVRDGITDVIVTPHQLGKYEGRNLPADIRKRVAEVQMILDTRRIPLRVISGGEVRVDERISKFLDEDRISTLADNGKYLLLELPTGVAIDAEMLLAHLEAIKPRIILAHSERYDSLSTDPEQAEEWVRRGAALQINAGAIVGAFGPVAERAVVLWISRGWVSLVATDAHSVGTRRPQFSEAIDRIEKQFGHDVARCVCIENPLRVLQGESLLPPTPAAVRPDPSPETPEPKA